MKLYADGEAFPGWAALQYCAREEFLQEERFLPSHRISRSLHTYPRTLAQHLREGHLHMSILLNTIGGSADYISLFRAAVRHIMEEGSGTTRTFAVCARSAGALIGMLAPKNHRYVTRHGQYLWHTGAYSLCSAEDAQRGQLRDIVEIQQELLWNVRREERRNMHRLLLHTLADEENRRHEIILSGKELHTFGIVPNIARDPEELAVLFAQRTRIRPNFWIPGTDPTARFFLRAALEERAGNRGYTLSFPHSTSVNTFSLCADDNERKRPYGDVREELREYAAEFPWRMAEILRGPSAGSG